VDFYFSDWANRALVSRRKLDKLTPRTNAGGPKNNLQRRLKYGEFESPEMLKALEGTEKRNYPGAFELLVRLAQTGNPKVHCNLANLYHFGWGVKMDANKAVELYHKVLPTRSSLRLGKYRRCKVSSSHREKH
jgi:hypothetical protein